MAVLLFKLNNVPEEEAEEVRRLLCEHEFEFYETSAGRWRLSVAAIWLKDDSQAAAARAVIDEYQAELTARVRREHAELAAQGRAPTLWRKLARQPLRVLFFTVAAAIVLALSTLPFLGLR
ncbi:hypothetical protein GCM10007160_31790 [Litchfieldella qijiaojingensis]|uniref:DUF2007 domain-containing protein n=1 Tax=Litchfieldella qijiaojingensis TaxID=980347 RepID=A0ABQ2Z4Y2_9GAMM|nr:DUF6164 family protein [Halomonas qijiaojingensis]GGY01524.1 hypothetical protein GCM10007160_31790 [Halomonas qijiaojingensis]